MKISILIIILTGCSPIHELYIDTACTPSVEVIIHKGIDKANEFAYPIAKEDVLVYKGKKNINHDTVMNNYANAENSVIVCFNSPPPQKLDKRGLGFSGIGGGHVILLLYLYEDQTMLLHIILHELGHLLGIAKHSDNRNDVMHSSGKIVIEYTDGDFELLKEISHLLE